MTEAAELEAGDSEVPAKGIQSFARPFHSTWFSQPQNLVLGNGMWLASIQPVMEAATKANPMHSRNRLHEIPVAPAPCQLQSPGIDSMWESGSLRCLQMAPWTS